MKKNNRQYFVYYYSGRNQFRTLQRQYFTDLKKALAFLVERADDAVRLETMP
jgi:hypothetical protein